MGNIADRLREAMTLRDLEVSDLVERTGLSKSAIHFILSGTTQAETIRAVNVDKLAEALSVDRDWFLYGRGTPNTTLGRSSQSVGLDLRILAHADYWVQIEEELTGLTPITSPTRRDDYLRRLAHVYALAEADGGRLSTAHAEQIMSEAKGERDGRGSEDRGSK